MVLEFWFGLSKYHFFGLKGGPFWQKPNLVLVFKNPKQSKKSKKSKKSKNLTNSDFTPDTCQKIEKMSILNSRHRGIAVVEMLILLSRYRGIVATQGNYPQKCCHSSMSSLRIMLLAKPYPANTYFLFSWSGNKLESISALNLWQIFSLYIS